MNDIRYLVQPTDMDGATFLSCLVNHTRINVPELDNAVLPVDKRASISIWNDDDCNNVACEIWDEMDEWGRYRRVRRFILVPDLDPDTYGYRDGFSGREVVELGHCDTCDIERRNQALNYDPCLACEWSNGPAPALSGYIPYVNIITLAEPS